MKIIQICPSCGYPGVKVNETAVMYNLRKSSVLNSEVKRKWYACINPECECSYFSKGIEFKEADLVNPLFYKDKSEGVPICYCSDLTRGEIKEAVMNGCRTIGEVQKFTKKEITGQCEKKNPLGKCCKQVFLRTIKDNIGVKTNKKQRL